MEILHLRRPIPGHCVFDAGTSGPAAAHMTLGVSRFRSEDVSFDVGQRHAAGYVGEPMLDRSNAEADTGRSKPSLFGATLPRRIEGRDIERGAAGVGPGYVAFHPKQSDACEL